MYTSQSLLRNLCTETAHPPPAQSCLAAVVTLSSSSFRSGSSAIEKKHEVEVLAALCIGDAATVGADDKRNAKCGTDPVKVYLASEEQGRGCLYAKSFHLRGRHEDHVEDHAEDRDAIFGVVFLTPRKPFAQDDGLSRRVQMLQDRLRDLPPRRILLPTGMQEYRHLILYDTQHNILLECNLPPVRDPALIDLLSQSLHTLQATRTTTSFGSSSATATFDPVRNLAIAACSLPSATSVLLLATFPNTTASSALAHLRGELVRWGERNLHWVLPSNLFTSLPPPGFLRFFQSL